MTWTALNCVFFCGLYFDFVLSPVSPEIQSFLGRFIFLYLSTLPRPDFPGSHGVGKHYLLVLFWARALQSFIIIIIIISYVFLPGVYKPCNDSYVLELHWWRAGPKVWRLNSQISQDGTFVKMKTSSKKRITNPFREKSVLILFLHWYV